MSISFFFFFFLKCVWLQLGDPSSVFHLVTTSVFNCNHLRSFCSLPCSPDKTRATQKLLQLNSCGLRHVLRFCFAFITFQRVLQWTRRLWIFACLNWPLAQVKGKWSLDLATDAGVKPQSVQHQDDMLGPTVLSDVKFAQLEVLWPWLWG